VAHRGRRNADEALALAAGQTLRDAATAAGIGERTATRRWADPTFRRRVAELRAGALEQASAKLTNAMSEAAAVLRKLLAAETESIQLAASRVLLDSTVKLREAVDLEHRIATLEKHLGGPRR
jgi:hypothetical protein